MASMPPINDRVMSRRCAKSCSLYAQNRAGRHYECNGLITSTANWTPFFIIFLKAADQARVRECDQAGWVYNLAALEFKKEIPVDDSEPDYTEPRSSSPLWHPADRERCVC